ncbi:MAG TPA: DUF1499 domain-containing protein [Usitatibacter sp.]|nr:DUF1499 domain-containing protein [Usitatibacter sp.]
MRSFRILALGLGALALVFLAVSGPVTHANLWSWEYGLRAYSWAAYTGIAAAGLGLVLTVLCAVPRWREGAWIPVLALCAGVAAVTPPILMFEKAKSAPPIHDITTDAYNPPRFVSLLAARMTAPNGAEYGGAAVAAQQQKGYPDIKPAIVNAPPGQAMQRAIDAARALGWEIAASDTATGHLEATDTTPWFGFKDDIVVRVRSEPSGGSRVDVRSASRVGHSDIGTNAARVREFLSRLA